MESNLDGLHFYAGLLGPFDSLLTKMERRGLYIDPDYFNQQAILAEPEEARLNSLCVDWGIQDGKCAINWRSSQQVGAFLYDKLKLPVSPVTGKGKAKRGERSTDNKALAWIRDYCKKKNQPIWAQHLDNVLDMRKCQSAIKYLRKFPLHADKNGYIHCNMAPDTETLRLAARCPELQQVPIRKEKDPYNIRRGFIAPPGMSYIVADQSQLEMRILGHVLKKMYNDDSLITDILADDCHGTNAIRIYGKVYPNRMVPYLGKEILLKTLPGSAVKKHESKFVTGLRETIKNIAYGLIYGMTEYSLGSHLKDEFGEPIGDEAALLLLNMFKDLYPPLREFFAWCGNYARRNGGMVDLCGGLRTIPDAASSDRWVRMSGERKAANTIMQRGAANIMALAMLRVEDNQKLKDMGFTQNLQIHDEIDGYCPIGLEEECMAEIKFEMESAMVLECPLEVEPGYGANWYDAK